MISSVGIVSRATSRGGSGKPSFPGLAELQDNIHRAKEAAPPDAVGEAQNRADKDLARLRQEKATAQKTNEQPLKYGRRDPWKEWFKNEELTLVTGRDFNGGAYTMAQQIRNAAARKRFSLRVGIEISEDESTVTGRILGPLDPTVPGAEDP